jgi:hypothetical protein
MRQRKPFTQAAVARRWSSALREQAKIFLAPYGFVHRGGEEGFVHQRRTSASRRAARHVHPLAHAGGQLRGIMVARKLSVSTDESAFIVARAIRPAPP